MSIENELIVGMLRGEGGFRDALRRVLEEDLKMSVHEFCSRTGLSLSTVYKIMQEEREPNLRTVRRVIKAVRNLEKHPGGNFIALIASRPVLDRIEERIVRIGEKDIRVKDYPASTMEEAIIAAIMAEKDGALAVVCAPIIAPTVEKILTIPVSVVIPRESMLRAIESAAEKTL
ncbi:MAG: helix-turn-helix domain-containing protein [Methanomassiliicoccales archaeon]|nr:helix-turn-helix domain-containing protein [Methanomassiliicoccales archaeon]